MGLDSLFFQDQGRCARYVLLCLPFLTFFFPFHSFIGVLMCVANGYDKSENKFLL